MKRTVLYGLGAAILIYLLLLIPQGEPTIAAGNAAARKPFIWNQDAFWTFLENRFVESRAAGCDRIRPSIDSLMGVADKTLGVMAKQALTPRDATFGRLENTIFQLASLIGACPDRFDQFRRFIELSRIVIKRQSESWDMSAAETRETLYRLLYGSRAAIEEIMVQLPANSSYAPLSTGADEPSRTPAASILGATIHSGDILLSRGGAPTSALIARGNDFPGNFSHVALVHVDSASKLVSILESHIERGVTISSVEEYLKDTKLRVMVLRLRSDLPQLQADPMIPHRAATSILDRARREHIPYDFAMDFQNSDGLFCSEVASLGYANVGLRLWMGLSTITSPGLRSWLGAFGVRHFETQEPSDLEYDPQLRVVAEWRDPETLRKDHMDNAVTEVMLEGAEAGEQLTYAWYMLPIARVVKAYSSVLNLWDAVGPIPEGMTATAALKNTYYSGKHSAINDVLKPLAQEFERQHSYAPPYWRLVEMARTAKRKVEGK